MRRAFLIVVALCLWLWGERSAGAIPTFARKYSTSCQTCHTAYPALNPFGEAFRRNGYRFPSQNESVDSDAAKEAVVELGQEEYQALFPQSVWPAKITASVPLSLMFTGNLGYRLPGSALRDAYGSSFTWNGILNGVRIYGAGAFSDRLTYFSILSASSAGTVSLDGGTLLWNDLIGPRHALNVWFGRLVNPQLTSYGRHASYVNDTSLPAISVAGLYNPSNTFQLGLSPADGVEVNGVVAHRLSYSVGWLASMSQTGLGLPNAEDFYAHVGGKWGGMSLDGEGRSGMDQVNAQKPWAETSVTVDAYAYHGVTLADNGTGQSMVAQRSAVDSLGVAARLHIVSLVADAGWQYQHHARPYPGTAAGAGPSGAVIPGVPDHTTGSAHVVYGEVDYVVFPWFVPGLRTEYTFLDSGWGKASLLRVRPGAVFLVRPNVKVTLTADVQRVYRLPPAPANVVSNWTAAGSVLSPESGQLHKVEMQQVNAFVAWSF